MRLHKLMKKRCSQRASWTMCCAHIEDSPRFDYRGLLLDEGRHFFGIDQVKRYLDIMEGTGEWVPA